MLERFHTHPVKSHSSAPIDFIKTILIFCILYFGFHFSQGQNSIPTFGKCPSGNKDQLEDCSKMNFIQYLNDRMHSLKDTRHLWGIGGSLPIFIKISVSANGEIGPFKVYETQWKEDLSNLIGNSFKHWRNGESNHEYIIYANYHFFTNRTFVIEPLTNDSIINKTNLKAQAEDDFDIGVVLMNKKDYSNAINRFINHLHYFQNNSNALYNLALCHSLMGDSIKACLYWNYLALEGDNECSQLISRYCNFDYSSYNVLQAIDVEVKFTVQEIPRFPGEKGALESYINDNLVYPSDARKNHISGRVLVSCIIDINGKIKDARVVNGIGGGCDEEALRIMNEMPLWIPAKIKGQPFEMQINFPINFVLH